MDTAAEVRRRLTYRKEDRVALLRSLPLSQQSAVIPTLSPYVQQDIINQLTERELVDIFDHLDLLSTEQLMMRIEDTRRRTRVLATLKRDLREKIDTFLQFHPRATLDLINFNYLWVAQTSTIAEAADALEAHYIETGRFPEVLVHDNGMLVGEVKMTVLVREGNKRTLGTYVTPVATVAYSADSQDIITTLTAAPRSKLVVLDEDESVLGIIYADDALHLFEKLPTTSLYDFAGLDQAEQPLDFIFTKFKNRSRWLILNLLTAFLAGSVIFLFEDTVDQLAILAVYIPIVAGMGGNAASQTFAVIMRGITLGTVSTKDNMLAVWRETGAGVLNGALIGLVVAVVSVVVNGSVWLGLVVALAMMTVHIVAGFAAAFIPLLLKRYGKDPATVSMVFVTTATDVSGMLALLGFGAWLLL